MKMASTSILVHFGNIFNVLPPESNLFIPEFFDFKNNSDHADKHMYILVPSKDKIKLIPYLYKRWMQYICWCLITKQIFFFFSSK